MSAFELAVTQLPTVLGPFLDRSDVAALVQTRHMDKALKDTLYHQALFNQKELKKSIGWKVWTHYKARYCFDAGIAHARDIILSLIHI